MDKAGLSTALAACGESIVSRSADAKQQSQYTDIRGALAMANEETSGLATQRVFAIFSDFLEELPRGAKPAEYNLNGARVLLLHRSGSDSRESTAEAHSALVARWVAEAREKGASEVFAMPISGATEHRITQALTPGAKPSGTGVSVIVDTLYSSAPKLAVIADALSRLAPAWPPPVTVTWFAVGGSALGSQSMPPVEFAPHLVQAAGLLSTREEFAAILEECALGTARWRRSAGTADVSGAIALQDGAGQFEAKKLLLVVSDLRGPSALSVQLEGSKVVMISSPSLADGDDQQGYFHRLNQWDQMFRNGGAGNVCRIQLRNLTTSSLVDCLQQNNDLTK